MPDYDPIQLEIFKHLFASIPEEMGVVLRKSSYSPNIKERRDFSCALFDAEGRLIAQAAHIPVHLGSMPLSVEAAIRHFSTVETSSNSGQPLVGEGGSAEGFSPGDVILLNDPYRGGTHLPDITAITPVFLGSSPDKTEPQLIGFTASRAHHADVGGGTPGSMGIAREIYQEGIIIPPIKIVRGGELNLAVWDLILANVRTPEERAGDLQAQLAANRRGAERLQGLVRRYGTAEVTQYMQALIAYSERMVRQLLTQLGAGSHQFTDYLDDDGIHAEPIPISVKISIQGDSAKVDFTGSAPQQAGGVNAVYAITLSAVYYVFRCLVPMDIPNNHGCLIPIEVIAPKGSVVNARHPAAVAGGNVETSQRIVDVLLGALAKAYPGRIPAASQGTMNNVTIGGWDPDRQTSFAYYETIGGGVGACQNSDGASGVHSHMTNTLNTPVEALEYEYPLRVIQYRLRQGSGGAGRFMGGEGIQRDIQVLTGSRVSLLTERRVTRPYGLEGGTAGDIGKNILVRGLEEIQLPGKGSFDLLPGDILSLRTPGGGGYGSEEKVE